jgi:uncharacterized protein
MSKTFQAQRLDVAAFVQAHGVMTGSDKLQSYERLALDIQAPGPDLMVNWRVQGESAKAVDGSVRPSLLLHVETELPLTCQRCMGDLLEPVRLDQRFIFVPDEAMAEALDEDSDDDVLALTQELDVHALIEDELLMAIPLIPRHDACPEPVPLVSSDAGFDAAQADQPHPFAGLAALKAQGKPDKSS